MAESVARTSPPLARRSFAVPVALALVYVLWGSTAPAMKVAVETIPPFAMVALRFALAGSLLGAGAAGADTSCRARANGAALR